MQNQTLTKSEMTDMNILWEMFDGGTVYDVLAKYDDLKPAYTKTQCIDLQTKPPTAIAVSNTNVLHQRPIQEACLV